MERYRSGHNEAVLKTVWGQPHKGSNPFLSAIINTRKCFAGINIIIIAIVNGGKTHEM